MNYCEFATKDKLNQQYHDTEWGTPVYDDIKLFEYLTYEILQCGLSWQLILTKRNIFRKCFDNFNFEKLALYTEQDIDSILNTKGMIRSPNKIKAIINNAQCVNKIRKEFGSFATYIWKFSNNRIIVYNRDTKDPIPTKNNLSDIISKDLKKRGFKFIGSITIYSYLQACGIINDHDRNCSRFKELTENNKEVLLLQNLLI